MENFTFSERGGWIVNIIRQIGLQRSGTNAIKALIELNFRDVYVASNVLGNKHDDVQWDEIIKISNSTNYPGFSIDKGLEKVIKNKVNNRDLIFTINVKDPCSWLDSYYRYQSKKYAYVNDGAELEFSEEFVKKSLRNWRDRILNWSGFYDQNREKSLIIRHEQLLIPGEVGKLLAKMQEKFGFDIISERVITEIDGYMRRGIENQHGEDLVIRKKWDKQYHLNECWTDSLPDAYFDMALDVLRRTFDESRTVLEVFETLGLPRAVEKNL